jgi:hypothetical protein
MEGLPLLRNDTATTTQNAPHGQTQSTMPLRVPAVLPHDTDVEPPERVKQELEQRESVPMTKVVQHATAEIKTLVGRTAQHLVLIGEQLQVVKAHLEHGQWLQWLRDEFGWSDQTARNMMHVAQRFKSKTVLNLTIDQRALYLLAAPTTPPQAADEAVELAQHGEAISFTRAKALVDKHRGDTTLSSPRQAEAHEASSEPPVVSDVAEMAVEQDAPEAVTSSPTITESMEQDEDVPRILPLRAHSATAPASLRSETNSEATRREESLITTTGAVPDERTQVEDAARADHAKRFGPLLKALKVLATLPDLEILMADMPADAAVHIQQYLDAACTTLAQLATRWQENGHAASCPAEDMHEQTRLRPEMSAEPQQPNQPEQAPRCGETEPAQPREATDDLTKQTAKTDADYDTTRFYLGKLCPHGHTYRDTGKTLRRNRQRGCVQCHRASWRPKRPAPYQA